MTPEAPLFFSELIERSQIIEMKIWQASDKRKHIPDPRKKKIIEMSANDYTIREIKDWFNRNNIPVTGGYITETRMRERRKGVW